jgi:hypothetical protein
VIVIEVVIVVVVLIGGLSPPAPPQARGKKTTTITITMKEAGEAAAELERAFSQSGVVAAALQIARCRRPTLFPFQVRPYSGIPKQVWGWHPV